MLGWFLPKADCPVDPETRAWVDGRWDWLERQFGADRARAATVVLPRPEFFPESYHPAEGGVRQMLDHVAGYMGVNPQSVEVEFYEDTKPVAPEPPGATDGRFRVRVEVSAVHDPLGLVAALAHELSRSHLVGRVAEDADDAGPLADLLTVYLGLGVFAANATLREQSWHAGIAGGWSIGVQGYLSMPTYGYALARFAQARHEPSPDWARDLRLDVRTAFQQSQRLLANEATGG